MMKPLFVLSFGLFVLAGCTKSDIKSLVPDNRPDYKQSRSINPLEIPPDLTQSSIDDTLVVPELTGTENARLSDYQSERGSAGAQKQSNLAAALQNIHSSGDATWIEMNANPDVVFKSAKQFWASNGLPLSRVDSKIGIMETDWLATKPDLPAGGISRLLSKMLNGLKDNGVRDKFRTRIDFDGKTTYVYMTHYGATEEEVTESGKKVKGSQGRASRTSDFAWFASSRNPELEVEMLRRLNLYLQRSKKLASKPKTDSKRAKPAESLRLSTLADGTPALVINSDFNQAWVLLGVAIDRAGYELTEQDRRNGTYTFAKITDKESGFIITDVTRTIETFQVGLADQGRAQIAVVRSYDGNLPSAQQAKVVLDKIYNEVKF